MARQRKEENKYRHPDEEPLSFSVNTIEEFQKDPVWREIVKVCRERMDDHYTALRDAEDMESVKYHQASIDQLDDIIHFPEWFKEEVEEDQRIEKQKSKE